MLSQLRDYQCEGIAFLTNTEYPNKILADDTGTGKTAQAVVAISELRLREPDPDTLHILIVCPLAVKQFWADEAVRWGGFSRDRITISGRGASALDSRFPELITIVHWEQLSDDRLAAKLQEYKWHIVVADECHRIKNRRTKRSRALKKLEANYKLALSANIIVNNPADLWSVLNWLYPQDWRSYWRFFENYVPYSIRYIGPGKAFKQVKPGVRNIAELSRRVQPFFLRRTKAEVLSELPAVTHTRLVVELSEAECALYKQVQEETLILLESGGLLTMPNQIARLVRLQQVLVGAGPFVNTVHPSKLVAALELIRDNPVPTIVFTKFRSTVFDLVAILGSGNNWKICRSDSPLMGDSISRAVGVVGGSDGAKSVDDFQSGRVNLIIATYGTLSEGVTLSRAERLIELDQTWSPLQQSQAEGRVHRIGTKRPVEIIRVIAKDTIDEKIGAALEHKWSTLELLYECI